MSTESAQDAALAGQGGQELAGGRPADSGRLGQLRSTGIGLISQGA
jgi:hypothetical protein